MVRGRNPLRSITIPRAIPPSPMTSMATTPTMNIWSIHGREVVAEHRQRPCAAYAASATCHRRRSAPTGLRRR